MARPNTSWSIDPDRLKARLVLEGYTCREASIMTNHCPQFISQCLCQGRMTEDAIQLIEDELGIKRRFFVLKKL